MTNMLSRGAAIAVLTMLGFGAQAATISGELMLGGQIAPDPGPDFTDVLGATFPQMLLVTGAFGDFAQEGLAFGSTGTINAISFTEAAGDLFTVGAFTFRLQSLSVELQSADFLNLSGTGVMSAAGFDDTPFALSLSADRAGSLYAFSATVSPRVVPVPGALILLLSGIAALGVRRRS